MCCIIYPCLCLQGSEKTLVFNCYTFLLFKKVFKPLACGFLVAWGPFLEVPEKFSHMESHGKISNLMIIELFNSMIFFNANRGSLHTRFQACTLLCF